MSDQTPEKPPDFVFPTEKFSYEDEAGRARRFDPADKPCLQIRKLIPPTQWLIYPTAPSKYLLIELLHLKQFARMLDTNPYLPVGKVLSQEEMIDWLARHGQDAPPWIESPEQDIAAVSARASTSDSPDAPLSPTQQDILVAMLEQGAFSSDSRRTADEIAKKAGAAVVKRAISELKRLALVETREGRGGGVWLTAMGRLRAERLAGNQ